MAHPTNVLSKWLTDGHDMHHTVLIGDPVRRVVWGKLLGTENFPAKLNCSFWTSGSKVVRTNFNVSLPLFPLHESILLVHLSSNYGRRN